MELIVAGEQIIVPEEVIAVECRTVRDRKGALFVLADLSAITLI